MPKRPRSEELLALPVEVWVDDDAHVRRVRSRPVEIRNEMIELWDFGVSLDDLDWTRLPTFRTPKAAAKYDRPH